MGGLGCHMENIWSNVFAYADHLVLLTTCSARRKFLQIWEEYAIEYDLRFNPSKHMLIFFCRIPSDRVVIKMFGRVIKNVKSEKHPVHLMSASGSLVDITHMIAGMKVRTNTITYNFYAASWQPRSVDVWVPDVESWWPFARSVKYNLRSFCPVSWINYSSETSLRKVFFFLLIVGLTNGANYLFFQKYINFLFVINTNKLCVESFWYYKPKCA